MRRIAVLLALVACFSLPTTGFAARYHPPLNEVESWLAGKPVKVKCLNERETARDRLTGFWGAAAYVPIQWNRPLDYTVFAWPWCHVLLDMQWGVNEWRWDYADRVWAVFVITHEAGHLRGASFPFWRSERQVNIWALKRLYAVAHLKFNVPESEKQAFNRTAISIYLGQPSAYNGGACPSPFLDENNDVRCAPRKETE